MTEEFEKWAKQNGYILDSVGANYTVKSTIHAHLAWQYQEARIEEIIKWVEFNKKSIPLSEWQGYTTEEYVDADDLLELLK